VSKRSSIHDYFAGKVAALASNHALKALQVNHDGSKRFGSDFGLTLDRRRFGMGTNPDGTRREVNGKMELIAYARVTTEDKTNRTAAFDKANDVAFWTLQQIEADSTLNGAVCDANIVQDWVEVGEADSKDSQIYAVLSTVMNYEE